MFDPLLINKNKDDESFSFRLREMQYRINKALESEKNSDVKNRHKNSGQQEGIEIAPGRATPFRKCEMPKEGYGGKTPEEIYQIFREYCDGCSESGNDELFASLDGKMTDHRIDEVIAFARKKGFVFSREEYLKISKIAREAKNFKLYVKEKIAKDQELWNRRFLVFAPLALNNYDYDELLREIANLKKLFENPIVVEDMCGKLLELIDETEKTRNSDYPGRHLPFDVLEGKKKGSMARYKRLRIMDELLYKGCVQVNTEGKNPFYEDAGYSIEVKPWLNDEMIKAVNERAKELGIYDEIKTNALNKDYVVLSELIMVNHEGGRRARKALLGAYDYNNGVKGHIYRKAYPYRDERVTAFMMTFNIDEALEIEEEINSIKTRFFNGYQYFNQEFPLLEALSRFTHSYLIKSLPRVQTAETLTEENDVSHVDFVTINYMGERVKSLRSAVEKCIVYSNLLALRQSAKDKYLWKVVEPIGIEDPIGWGFWAIESETGKKKLYNIRDFSDYYAIRKQNVFLGSCMLNLNLNSLYCDKLWKIELLVNSKQQAVSYLLKQITQSLECRLSNPIRESDTIKIGFEAYINDALLDAIWQLDLLGSLFYIKPMEVRDFYECYLEKVKVYQSTFQKGHGLDKSDKEGYLFPTIE